MSISVSGVDGPPALRPPDIAPSNREPRIEADAVRERTAQPPPRAPLPPGQGTRIDLLV